MLKLTSGRTILGATLAACIVLASMQQGPEQLRPTAAAGGAVSPPPALPQVAMTPAISPVAAPAATDLHAVELAVQQARAGGKGEGEAYRLRAATLSTQTIAMLTEREHAEKLWLQRLDAWRAQRQQLDPADTAGQQALRARLFSPEEQGRLEAYDSAGPPTLILR